MVLPATPTSLFAHIWKQIKLKFGQRGNLKIHLSQTLTQSPGVQAMAVPVGLQQLASDKERELQSLRQQHTQLLEQAIQGKSRTLLSTVV